MIAVAYTGSLGCRVVHRCGGNITGLFCIGDRHPVPSALAGQDFYVHRDWVGYDGQLGLFLSFDPFLRGDIARSFDGPAYRCQRIGLPMLAHALAMGNEKALPYALVALNLVAFLVGCWFFLRILERFRASPGWVLAYAFTPGFLVAELRVVPDATATSLIVVAIWALLTERWGLAAGLFCAGVLVKETTLVMSTAVAAWAVFRGEPRKALAFLLPVAVYALWSVYVRARVGDWPIASGFGANFAWPMVGVIEKFIVILPMIPPRNPHWRWVIPVEIVFNLGLLFSLSLAVKRLKSARREWLTFCFCAYAALAVVLSSFPWSRYWHTARVLDLLVLLPLLVYLRTKDYRFLVPLVCAAPVSVAVLFAAR